MNVSEQLVVWVAQHPGQACLAFVAVFVGLTYAWLKVVTSE